MKRLFTLLILIMTLLLCTPVYAEGDEGLGLSSSGDKVSVGQDIKIDKMTVGNVVSVGGDVEIYENVTGEVVVIFGNVTMDAEVTGQVITIFGDIKMTHRSSVGGNLITIGAVDRDIQSRVIGEEINLNLSFLPIASTTVILLMAVFAFFTLLLGFPMLAVFRDRFNSMSGCVLERIGLRIALGFLVYLGLTIFLPILTITLVAPLLYFILLILAEMITGIFIGRILTKTLNMHPNIFLEFTTGFLIITTLKAAAIIVLSLIGLPMFGIAYVLLSLFVNSFGLGVLADTKFGSSVAR